MLTVGQLKEHLSHIPERDNNLPVVIKARTNVYPAVGPSYFVPVESCMRGFDWNAGQFFMFPEQLLQLEGLGEMKC